MEVPKLLKYQKMFQGQKDIIYEYLPISDRIKHVEKPLEPDRKLHPCWCQPVLEYRDPVQNNEIWIHIMTQ